MGKCYKGHGEVKAATPCTVSGGTPAVSGPGSVMEYASPARSALAPAKKPLTEAEHSAHKPAVPVTPSGVVPELKVVPVMATGAEIP